ncbi:acylphosphatase [Desulfonatronum zhilinae]|nr:acylphosphatase [Desulfonatronum zhilinae]
MNILHAHVRGRVQGVYFRGWTRSQAQRLELSGWVRNLRDGRVEVLARGDEAALRELEKLLWQGPSFSRVDDVAVSDVPEEEPTPEGFHIAPTV